MARVKEIIYIVIGFILSSLIFAVYSATGKPTYIIKKQKIKGDHARINTELRPPLKKKRRFLSFLKRRK